MNEVRACEPPSAPYEHERTHPRPAGRPLLSMAKEKSPLVAMAVPTLRVRWPAPARWRSTTRRTVLRVVPHSRAAAR